MTLKKTPEIPSGLSRRKTLHVPDQPAPKRKLPTLADLEEQKPTLGRRSPPQADEGGPARRSLGEGGPARRSLGVGGLVREDPKPPARPLTPRLEQASPEPLRLAGAPARRRLPQPDGDGPARRSLDEGGLAREESGLAGRLLKRRLGEPSPEEPRLAGRPLEAKELARRIRQKAQEKTK